MKPWLVIVFVIFFSVILFSCTTFTSTKTSVENFPWKKRVGLVSRGCIELYDSNVQTGTKLYVLTFHPQQKSQSTEIVGKCSLTEAELNAFADEKVLENLPTYYALSNTSAEGIGFFSTSPPHSLNGEFTVDLDGDGREESFKECASHEGLHRTVWTGELLIGVRRWHSYLHLSYDVDPSCKEVEWAVTVH